MQREKKVWGDVCHVFESPHAAVSYLRLKRGFCCSIHRHRYRANQFMVLRGRVVIEFWGFREDPLTNSPDRVTLEEDQAITVHSDHFHRFIVEETGDMIEVYWADVPGAVVMADDIERVTEGGPVDN